MTIACPCGDAWSLGIVGVWAANTLGNASAAASPISLLIMHPPTSATLLHPHVRGAVPPMASDLRYEDGGQRLRVTSLPEVAVGPNVTCVPQRDSLGQEPVAAASAGVYHPRSEEHTSELQSRLHLVCRLLL